MRPLLLLPLAIAAVAAAADEAANYQITINGQTSDVKLGSEYTFTTASGEAVTYVLTRKEIVTYSDEVLSFQHKGEVMVSTVDIDAGVTQILAATALGTRFVVQEYTTMDPTSFNEAMLKELTKEGIGLGFEMTQEPFSKQLKGGETLNGISAVLKQDGQEKRYTIVSYAEGESGVIVATVLDQQYAETEAAVIDLLWESLTLK